MSDNLPTVSMKLDVKENDKEFQVHAEVPGLAKVSTHPLLRLTPIYWGIYITV